MTRFYEEFEVGAIYSTKSRLINDADQDTFCSLVGYDVPLFMDDDYAQSRGLPGRICPSHLVMSFSTAMTGELFQDSVIALAGIEGAKFIRHVRPGDTIRTEVEVVQKRLTSKPKQGLIVFRDHVYNQFDEEVFRNDKHVLIRCRDNAPSKS